MLSRGYHLGIGEDSGMVAKKLPARRAASPPKTGPQDINCPHCGALESAGGCKDPAECARALAKAKSEYAREITSLIDHAKGRSLPLLMAGFEALDLLNIGLVVTNASGSLLMANGAAEQILVSRDGLELTDSGVFGVMKGCGNSLGATLQRAAHSTNATSGEQSEETVFAVHRQSGKRAYTLLVRPAARSAEEREISGSACALVFILDPELPVQTAETELRQLYGITATEARLANLLMEGKTLDVCCDLLKIRRSTGRTHLQHLFEKVGVQRQTELVSVLLKSIGLLRTQPTGGAPGSASASDRLRQALLNTLMSRAARASNLM
jgi:DNA-binding CsgD family transcriptional regulator